MEQIEINKTIKLSEHYTLGEMTKTSTGMMNIPSRVSIENLKRVCGWLEALRCRYNQRYVLGGSSSSPKFLAEPSGKAERGEDRRGLNERQVSPSSDHPEVTAAPSSDHPAHPGTPPNSETTLRLPRRLLQTTPPIRAPLLTQEGKKIPKSRSLSVVGIGVRR